MADANAVQCRQIETLGEIVDHYDAIFCDVWGVVHNGVSKFASAEQALVAARGAGRRVVLLTNSPRRSDSVIQQLGALGFDRKAYDHVVTSGDATRDLIAKGDGPIFHIGPERDVDLFTDLGIERVPAAEATRIVATGLFDDENETPDAYRGMLGELRERDLPMICANPDIVVHRGEKLIYCAGALAREYGSLGGTVALAGKPHRPIYDLAMRKAGLAEGDRQRMLAIGDGLPTDIRGADDFGIDALFVTGGIHGDELNTSDPAATNVERLLSSNGLVARFFIPALK